MCKGAIKTKKREKVRNEKTLRVFILRVLDEN